MMDYSQVHDPEHPDGTSPWSTTSPRPERSDFAPSNDSAPSSPTKTRVQPGETGRENATVEEQQQDDDAQSDPPTPTAGLEEPFHPSAAKPSQAYRHISQSVPDIRFQGPPLTEEELRQEQMRQQRNEERYQQQLHAQQHQRGPGRYHGNKPGQRQTPHYKLQARISTLERTGKKDPSFHFDVHTNLPKFRTTQVRDIKRTHSEFVKLAEHLISNNPEALVPAVPPALTSAGAGTEEDEVRTKTAMQRWLNSVCSNDILMRDDEMVFFVEGDAGYSPMMRMKQPATGVRRKVIKQFAPPPDDTPELRDARPTVKAFYLGTMDAGQRLDRLVKSRRGLGLAESDFGVRMGQMHVQETHPGLSIAFRKLGKITQMAGDFHAAQGTAEATTFGDSLNYHSSDAFIVKETLTNRHILLRELISAQQATRSKLTAADRLKSQSNVRREKVDEAISLLEEARTHEEYLEGKTKRVTTNLLQEKRRWFARTAADLRTSIREYALREIEAERRTLALLESVRPDIRNIDASGGLSRLGREAHPATRRASMQASQGPRGDAWSGVPRREGALERSISGLSAASKVENDNTNGEGANRKRAVSGSGSLKGIKEDDGDEDRVDARNAASRLAQSTF